MSTRDAEGSARELPGVPFDALLSPCETYEGSRHYTVCDVDGSEGESTDADPTTRETVVMSPALLAEMRRELREQALRDPPHARPTQRVMRATRP